MSNHISLWFQIFIFITSLSGLFLNGLATRKLLKNFRLRRSIFLLIFFDLLVSLAGCLGSAVVVFLLDLPGACLAFIMFCYCPYIIGLAVTSIVASIRYISTIKTSRNQTMNPILVLTGSFVTLSLIMSFVVYLMLDQYINECYHPVHSICLTGRRNWNFPIERTIASNVLVMILVFVSVSLDVRLTFLIKKKVSNVSTIEDTSQNTNDNHALNEDILKVPIRATLFSALSVVPQVFFVIAQFFVNLSDMTAFHLVVGLANILCAIRAPCSVQFTISQKREEDARERHRNSIEQRRQKEIDYALKERELRRQRRNNIAIISFNEERI